MKKIAVIGVGRFGTNLLNTFSQLSRQGRCQLVAICDINPETLKRQSEKYGVRGYLDYREMLQKEKVDAVAIATPDPFHREPVLYAAGLGKHIFVEKPMDTTVEGCLEMIQACENNRVLLQVDFHKRFDPYHREIARNVREGKIGRVEYGYVHMEDRIEVPWKWFPGWAPRSSPVWFLGIHFFDLIRWIIGSDGKRVYATGKKWKLKSLGIDTYDAVSAMVEFQNGAAVTFDLSWILPEKFEAIVNQGLRLVGENGMIECDTQDRGTRVCFEKEGVMTYNLGFLSEGRNKFGQIEYSGYGIESIADFVYNLEYLDKGGSVAELANTISGLGRDGLEATKIAVAVHRSLETGQLQEV
ncbi:MAG TPA: Gfo/Idh/MocA family oxidoreductase [bacterium]|nr:Gfo/Idh/MocA family oxidoreductase [bacterium]HOL66478.1 Gfo/Idh/MocA family oxidoreductase [bacterium]